MSTKLSIILPAYNSEEFIRDTIESILRQTLKDFELIVVNDGSDDNTLDLIKGFEDPRIFLINKQHSGIVDSFNLGLDHAKGEYIARIDSDDIYYQNKFEIQTKFLDYHDDTVLVGTDAHYMAKNSHISTIKINVPQDHDKIIKNLLIKQRALIQSTIVTRKNILKQIGGYEKNFYPEDYNLFFKLSEYGKLKNINIPLAAIRIHESYSHRNLSMLIKNHDILIKRYALEKNISIIKTKKSFINIYLNRKALYYYLNKHRLLSYLTILIAIILSPISTFKTIKKKLTR